MVGTKSHDRDLTTKQGKSSAGSRAEITPNLKTGPNYIYRRIRPRWTYRCSNIFTHTQNHQRRIYRHRRYSQCLCSGINGDSNGSLIIRRTDREIQKHLHLYRQSISDPNNGITKATIWTVYYKRNPGHNRQNLCHRTHL